MAEKDCHESLRVHQLPNIEALLFYPPEPENMCVSPSCAGKVLLNTPHPCNIIYVCPRWLVESKYSLQLTGLVVIRNAK